MNMHTFLIVIGIMLILAIGPFVIEDLIVNYRQKKKKRKSKVTPIGEPKFILHGGEIRDGRTGEWVAVGPTRVAELYGLKSGTWMAANSRIGISEQLPFYGSECIHLCPLQGSNYKHRLSMMLAMYKDGDTELLLQMFYDAYYAEDFIPYVVKKQLKRQ